jgi:hypothetical protein
LRVDVAAHARMVRVGVAAVAGGHPGGGDIEGHVEEGRQLPQILQLVAVQEQPVRTTGRACSRRTPASWSARMDLPEPSTPSTATRTASAPSGAGTCAAMASRTSLRRSEHFDTVTVSVSMTMPSAIVPRPPSQLLMGYRLDVDCVSCAVRAVAGLDRRCLQVFGVEYRVDEVIIASDEGRVEVDLGSDTPGAVGGSR